MKLTNNTILITGGTAGIGLELVRQFYPLNNAVIVVSGNADNLAKLKEQFPELSTIVCDLGRPEAVQDLINYCMIHYRSMNVLINNAGIQYNYNWMEETGGIDKIRDEININFTSPMQLIYGLLPLLSNKQEAAIVNITSGLIYAPKKSAPVYCGTKSALHNATKAIRYQLENSKIKVFEIIPPLVDTAMTAGRGKGKITPRQLTDQFMKNFRNDQFEIKIGKTKLLYLIQRLSPFLADRIMKAND